MRPEKLLCAVNPAQNIALTINVKIKKIITLLCAQMAVISEIIFYLCECRHECLSVCFCVSYSFFLFSFLSIFFSNYLNQNKTFLSVSKSYSRILYCFLRGGADSATVWLDCDVLFCSFASRRAKSCRLNVR